MAANDKNINGGLTRIKFPNLDEAEFGKSLADQFKNIDLNFQKLGNINLGKGDDGAGCTYINYNLNSIFFYWTGYSDNSNVNTETNSEDQNIRAFVERQNFRGFYDFIMSGANPLHDRVVQLKKEVDADLQEFKDLTGGTEEDYVRMCAFLLFGQPMVYDHYKKTPEGCSLFGALLTEYDKSAQASVDGITYSSMWLLDWWNAGYKTDITATKRAEYKVGDERVDLFLTHMQLFDPGRITVAVAPALDNDKYAVNNYHPVGSLAYVYLDPRFRNHSTGDEVDDVKQWTGQSEISCVLYWSPRPLGHMHITSNDGSWDDHTCTGGFKVVNLFPQIYFDGTGFYWKINGTETKIPVTGRPGADGKNSQFVVVERIGNIKGAVYNGAGYDSTSQLWGPWPLKQSTSYEEWLGKEKIIRTVHSGRAARNENYSAYENAQTWIADHIDVEFDVTRAGQFETVNGVTSANIAALEGWLPDATGFNSTEILHLYRIWGIVGRECFWRVKDGMKVQDNVIPFRVNDPSYSKYNFGVDDAVELITNGATQNQMKALDGAPCIVVADPAYIYDRTNTTVWFSTLKAVKAFANKNDSNIMLVAYCGDENQMTTEIDDHGMAGIMQHLDPYTYKSTGSNRNKPRGLMLPIGSAEITESQIASDIYGSHIIHSDLGGFEKREQHTVDTENGKIIEYCGITQSYGAALADINGDTMRSNNKLSNHATEMLKDPQFGEVKNKRFMHIGSVNDFRTLDYVPGPDEFSPATPGRKTDHTFLKDGLFGKKTSVPYGTAGFFGENSGGWFKGSELHVDEPVTITRYRDLQCRGTLLHVEGDTVIGPHKHVNFPDQYLHNRRDGGLFVQSTLTNELLEDTDIWNHTVFNKVFGTGILPKFRPYTRDIRGKNTDYNDWNITLPRTQGTDGRFMNGWLGAWNEFGESKTYDNVSNKDGQVPGKPARASILADDMIGARMMLALDGLAIIDQQYILNGLMTTSSTPFSVDRKGNIQTLGSEVRSNAQDTFWAFHTRWPREGQGFESAQKAILNGQELNVYPAGFTNTTVPSHNELMFGTTHQLYKINFGSKEGGSIFSGFNHWRLANSQDYLWYANEDENGNVIGYNTNRIPSQLTAGYVTNVGYAKTDELTHAEIFCTAFNTDESLRAQNQSGDLMPFITRMWCDLLYQEGALAVKGAHFVPVTTAFLGEYYTGRYGINSEYGLVIGLWGAAANDPVKTEHDVLKARYSAHERYSLAQLNTDDTLGTYNEIKGSKLKWMDGDINMFEAATQMAEAPIGIWSRPGILTEESLIAQKDLWVGRVASVRGQIRAMSFRRHTNAKTSVDKEWAFLLDDGSSSVYADQKFNINADDGEKFDPIPFDENNVSPIYLDWGEDFGPARLIKFGVAPNIKATSTGELVIDRKRSGDPKKDRNICLYANDLPFRNIMKTESGFLFSNNTGYLPFSARLAAMSGVCALTITITVNLIHIGRDNNKKGWFGRHRHNMSFGISNNTGDGQNDWGLAPSFSESGERGQFQNAINKGLANVPNTMECDGATAAIKKLFSGAENLLPPKSLTQFIGSLYVGRDDCNWNAGGTDSDRSFQKGLVFRLNTSGSLDVYIHNECGALFGAKHDIVLNFTWIPEVASKKMWYKFIRSYSSTIGNKYGSESAIQSAMIAPSGYTASSSIPYVLVQRGTSWKDNPTAKEITWSGIWEVFETYTQSSITYWGSNQANMEDNEEADGAQSPESPINPGQITNQTTIAGIEALLEREYTADEMKQYVGNYKYLWQKRVLTLGGETSTSWILLYPDDDEINGVGGATGEIDLFWDSLEEPTNASILSWLQGSARSGFAQLLLESTDLTYDTAANGMYTITPTVTGNVPTGGLCSLFVTSKKKDLIGLGPMYNETMSHRSIIFEYTISNNVIGAINLKGTYII